MNTPLAALNEEPPVIEIHNVVKEYRLGAFEGLRTLGRRLLGRSVPDQQKFRALDDISLTIRRGEVVGIIGHNGAGKSTLLKLLCRITNPTGGTVKVNGRIAPLIEVGAGLVGDMTGRENIYLNATILGLTRAEIDAKIEEIIEFSELEQFIDTPIKRYSSGMQVRLGYAIATAVDSEILIVDEVLAVGDLQFQRKSIERMQRLIQNSQRTILIVGHNIRQLERLCTRMILISRGRILMDGSPVDVTNEFLATSAKSSLAAKLLHGKDMSIINQRADASGEVTITGVNLKNSSGKESNTFSVGDDILVELHIVSMKRIERVDMAIAIHTPDMMNIGMSPKTIALPQQFDLEIGNNVAICHFESMHLLPGAFFLKVGINDSWGHTIWHADNLCPFTVLPPDGVSGARYSAISFVQFDAEWSVTSFVSNNTN